ncbi:hypothetical protein WJX73_009390 [Symbiochloris irregularis]|uniref:Phytanoyl-CoA dioxygenase n=1 Tax=Symbiochloris irregularis TaxID=706552 RepID=A0AAW1PNR2_9CHLO
MTDSSLLYQSGRWHHLRTKLSDDGYLLIRGLLPAESCLQAYAYLCRALSKSRSQLLHKDGRLKPGAAGMGLLSRQDLAAHPLVQQVLEAAQLESLMKQLLQEEDVVTTKYKWLRAVARQEFTGVHADSVYLGKGSQRMLTAWLPLGDVPRQQGAMMVCRGSHRKRAFSRLQQGYGSSSVGQDGTCSGWLGSHPDDLADLVGNRYAIDWRTADLGAGDVVVLSLGIIHMTAPNETDQVRISCDTRWLPAGDARDPRAGAWQAAHAVAA